MLVCVRVRFLDLFNGIFSLCSSIKPLLSIFTRNSLQCLPPFPEQSSNLQLFAHKRLNSQPSPFSLAFPAVGWTQLCLRLTRLWLQGERGKEVGPPTAALPEHHLDCKKPAGAAALRRRAEASLYAFVGGLIFRGGLRAKIRVSVKDKIWI